jgi:hypothetical protein
MRWKRFLKLRQGNFRGARQWWTPHNRPVRQQGVALPTPPLAPTFAAQILEFNVPFPRFPKAALDVLHHAAAPDNVRTNRDFLRGIDRNEFIASVFMMFVTAVVCLKHEGFHEEREWRITYSPKRMPSPLMESSVEVVAGVPQLVYKIPLENNPDADLSGIDLRDLLDRIIIGPSQFPWVMYEAFVAALDAAGVKDAPSRVFVSQIPVRT